MTKYQFLQDMTVKAYNRRRAEMGLPPVSAAQMESSAPDEPPEAADSKQEDE